MADRLPTVGRLSTDSRPTVGRLSVERRASRPTVDRPVFWGALLHNYRKDSDQFVSEEVKKLGRNAPGKLQKNYQEKLIVDLLHFLKEDID